MNRDDVMRWVGGYERAWRTGDLDAVADAVGWCLAAAPQGRPV